MKVFVLVFLLFAAVPACVFADIDAAVTAVERGDYPEALKELSPLLKQGDKVAQSLMGFMYFNGFGIQRNLKEAIHYFRQASEQGHESARLWLGIALHANGELLEAAEHLKWAANKNSPEAQYLLAMMYSGGMGVPQDNIEALRLYRSASDLGYGAATTKLGQFYYAGLGGLEEDQVEGVRLFRLAADKGEAQAQTYLGVALYEGKGVPANPKEAITWWTKASANGWREADAFLGVAYHEGKGVKRDDREAAKWMKQGAEGGSAFAQLTLGEFYRDGIGVERNLVTALMWMRLAEARDLTNSANPIRHILELMTPEQINEADRLAHQRLRKK